MLDFWWRKVDFTGARHGVGPLTWGQRRTWDDIQYFYPEIKGFYVMRRAVPVPPGLSLEKVLDGIRAIVERHEALRTHFREGSAGPEQSVLSDGEVQVAVFEIARHPTGDLLDLMSKGIDKACGVIFEHETELPVRFGVALSQNTPILVTLAFSRLTVDMQSAVLASTELFTLFDAAARGEVAQLPEPGRSPLDQVEFERSERGRRLNRRSMANLRRDLEAIEPSMFGAPVPLDGPRYWRGCLDSEAAALAVTALSRRYAASPSALLLAVTTSLLNALTGTEICALGLIYGNRSVLGLKGAVGSLSQTALVCVPVRPGSFGAHAETVSSSMTRSYINACFDTLEAAEIVREVSQRRGVTFDLECRFNDMWSRTLGEDDAKADVEPGLIRDARARSAFSWTERTDSDKISFYLDISGTAKRMRLLALADTHRIPPAAIQGFLEAVERVLAALAERDLDLVEIVELADLGRFRA